MSFVDSICVKFLSPSLIIYGKGNQLLLHDEGRKTIERLKPTKDKIHRISFLKCDNNTFKIACSAGRELFITEIKENSFNRAVAINTKFSDWISGSSYLRNGSIAIITAHNVALLLEIDETSRLVVKQKLTSEENSTLYCAHISGDNSWQDLIFLCGTALGELIIWKGTHNCDKTQTLFQKSLHNGVIFSIDYSNGLIVTSSDDRSIKIFKPNDDLSKLHEQKQLFGHTSRVFACKIIKYNDSIKFLSAGEDANLCVWNEDGSLNSKKNISASGGIWNLDYDQSRNTVVTCSATGKLNRFQLDKIFFEEHHHMEKTSTCEKIDPTKLIYLANGTLCVLDSNMQIFTKSSSFDSKSEWMLVVKLMHKIVAIDAHENRLFLLAKNSILIYDSSDDCNKLNLKAEINIPDKFALPNGTNFYFRAIHVLSKSEIFISDMHGFCFVLNVELEKISNLFKLPQSAEPWTTAVMKYQDKFWIVGDRVGSLLLFKNDTNLNSFHPPIYKIHKLHGQYGVTTIRLLDNDNGFFKTTSIGGTIKTLFLNESTQSIEVYQTEKTPVISVQTIRTYNENEYMLGFNDNYFVICKQNQVIYEHRCGGKHRHWDITEINSGEDDCKLRFTYINKKQVHSVDFYANDFSYNLLPDSNVFWHLKGCNVIRMIDDAMILISAGEDTFLKLTHVGMKEDDDDVSFRNLANINSHISSIKALATFKKDNDLFILSVGGRAQIVLTRVIRMKYVKEEINFMLTDFYNNNSDEGERKKTSSSFDPETRFTCVHFEKDTNILIVGCSDGFIRVFKLKESSLQLIIESFYGRCILQLTAIKNFVISMATDGVVCFWLLDELQRNMRIIEKLQHNKNGINSFDMLTCEKSYKIATAGDDSGIFVTEFEILKDDCIKLLKTIKSYRVHIAQVTGVKFLSHNEILTASIDQTVCKLKIRDDSDMLEIVDKRFTCISDVKGFAVFDKKFIFIHGAGLEKLDYF